MGNITKNILLSVVAIILLVYTTAITEPLNNPDGRSCIYLGIDGVHHDWEITYESHDTPLMSRSSTEVGPAFGLIVPAQDNLTFVLSLSLFKSDDFGLPDDYDWSTSSTELHFSLGFKIYLNH
ncbi:MAG: hypothetical protein DRP47_07480 [Candidatus Zixiibacteriota bacterium]|nr:MAG: hypothetical protein DRP47_07480 [candidate division Zixibacteria bacterium]